MLRRVAEYEKNAEELYPKLLKAVGVRTDRETGEIVMDSAGLMLTQFGLPDLLFRLQCQCQRESGEQDPVARARIWRHCAEGCRAGAQVPDITDPTLLNSWLPSDYPRFTRDQPARGCEACGIGWDIVTNHYSGLAQQDDPSKPWLCWWCLKQPAIRQRYGIATTERGACSICGVLWELVDVGGHVPTGSGWTCGSCFRAKSGTIAPRAGYAASTPGVGLTCGVCGDRDMLIAYAPERGVSRSYLCSACYGQARSAAFARAQQDEVPDAQLQAEDPIPTTTAALQVPVPPAKVKECALRSQCCRAVRRRGHPVSGRGRYCCGACRGRAKLLAKQKAAADSDSLDMASQTRMDTGEEWPSLQIPAI